MCVLSILNFLNLNSKNGPLINCAFFIRLYILFLHYSRYQLIGPLLYVSCFPLVTYTHVVLYTRPYIRKAFLLALPSGHPSQQESWGSPCLPQDIIYTASNPPLIIDLHCFLPSYYTSTLLPALLLYIYTASYPLNIYTSALIPTL